MVNKVNFLCFLILAVPLIIPLNSFSQNRNICFERLSAAEGLTLSTFHFIYQDSKGFIWLGTEGGLYRYDGYNFKIYKHDPDNPESLSHDDVYAICEDRPGNFWIGTYGGGLNRFSMKTETFTQYLHQSEDTTSLSDNEVHSIIKDHLGKIWIGTYGGGLNKLTNTYDESIPPTFIRYKHTINDFSSIGGNEIYSICEDRLGVIWIGTENGLSRYIREEDNFKNYRHNLADPQSLSIGEVYSIYEDVDSFIWIGTGGGGLNKMIQSDNKDTLITFVHYRNDSDDPTSISDNTILTIIEDNKGFLWIGTWNGGLNIFNKKTKLFTCYKYDANDPTSLSGNTISSIYEDASGVIWIGPYNGGGLHKFNRLKEQFNPYRYYLNKPSNIKIKNVWDIYEDRSGYLWVGTFEGLYKFDCASNLCLNYFHYPGDPTSLSNNQVSNILEDRSGVMWITTYGGGLNKFDREKDKFIHYKNDPYNPQSLSHNIVLSIYEDNSGTIWIGTFGGGLSKFDKEKEIFQHYTHNPEDPKSLSDNKVFCLYEDRLGNFWIGTWSRGLSKFDRDKEEFIHYTDDANDSMGISANFVSFIYEDKSNVLWIGTDVGLFKYDRETDSFKNYRVKNGLPSDLVLGVLEDDKGNLWLSTNNGLSKFNPANETFRNYDMSDGLQGNAYNSNAYYKTGSGEFIFGGSYGWDIFHPDSLMNNTHYPPVVITEFKLFNESVPIGFDKKRNRIVLNNSITETSELELSYLENVLSFEFTALDFHAPEKNKYAYKMEGFEEKWNYTDASRRFVTYTNLDPGEYRFRVKASNNHGVWNKDGASLKIIILPPWWATNWAYLLYAILIISIIYFTWMLQLKRVKNKHELELTKFEAEKMHEVDEMKSRFFANISHEFRTPLTLIFGPAGDVIEETNEPNTKKKVGVIKRNAIRLYGLVNQLLDLSKLEAGKMKLEASEQNIIPLLKGYVLSFSSLAERKKIKLNFNGAEDNINVYIDRDKVEKIITNLLSNAFKFTPEEGKIDVTIEKQDNWAEIEITDNGIGIAKERLNKIFDRFYQVDGSHTRDSEGVGIGLSLTKELIELHKGKIEVESEYGKGTTFKILLPLGKEHLKSEEITGKVVSEEIKVTSEEDDIIPEEKKLKARKDINALLETDKPILLIVEDNSDLRSYIVDHLKEEFRIQEAEDGEDGLNQAIKHIPDLIISDVMMPKMDGFELCNKLKTDERTSHIPIIMLTAKATNKDKIVGYESGADDYIIKPFESDVLKVRIKNLIDQRRKLQAHFRKEGLIEIEDKEITSIDKKFLQSVIKIISDHLSDTDFTIEKFAKELSMSRRNLDRKLIALSGESPSDIIKRVRLSHASKLLTQKSVNISEVALKVGFSNPAYFAKCFSEQFGLTPSEYKTSRIK